MKKLLCAALVLVMSIMCALALIGCDPTDSPSTSGSDNSTTTSVPTSVATDADTAKNAITALRGMYIGKAEETPADYTVIGQVKQNGQTYSVTWTVSPAEGCAYSDIAPYVKVGEMDAATKLVTISVTKAEKEIAYVLQASVTVGSATETLKLNRKVPAIPAQHDGTEANPYSAANVQEIALKLGDNEFLMGSDNKPKLVYVEGYIVDCGVDKGNRAQFVYIVDEYSADKNSNSPDAVMVYSITYDDNSPVTKFSDIGLGDKIKVLGFIEKYVKSGKEPQPEVTYNGSTSVKAVTLEKAADSRTDAEKVAAALEGAEKDLKAKVYTAVGEVELPTSSVYGVEVTWSAATSDLVTVAENKMTIASIPETATTVELTVTAKLGETQDSKKITITVQKPADLGTTHAGTEADPFSVADAKKIMEPLDGNNKEYFTENGMPKAVYVKGYVTNVGEVNSGNTRLNNVYISDTENGTDTLLVYSISFDKTFVTKVGDLAVGDLITIKGYLQKYYEKMEVTYNDKTNDNVVTVALVKSDNPNPNPPTPVDPPKTDHAGTQADPYSVKDATAVTKALAADAYLLENGAPKQVYVKGYVVDAGTFSTQYNNYNNVYIADTENGTEKFLVFRIVLDNTFLKGDGDLKVGALVTLTGVLQNYKGNTPELTFVKGGLSVTVVAMENGTTPTPTTDAEKVTAELAKAELLKTTYNVAGEFLLPTTTVEGMTFAWASSNETYVTIANGAMTVVSIPETETKVTITLTATLNEATDTKTFEITLVKAVAPTTVHEGTQADPYSVADAKAVASSLAANAYLEENGAPKAVYVKGYVTDPGSFSTKYNNFSNIKIADEKGSTETFLVYRVGLDDKFLKGDGDIKVDDLVTFVGYLKNHNGDTPELANNGNVNITVVAMEKAPDTRTDAQKVADALAKVKDTLANVTAAGSVDLPTSSEEAVTFTWTLKEASTVATVEGGKLTVATLPEADTVVTLTLTATCGTETQSKNVTVTVKKAVVVDPNATKVSTTIEAYAKANSWANQTQYLTLALDNNITASVAGGSNTGKFYTNGQNWRIYQNEEESLTFTAATGYTIATVKVTYTINNTGILASADGTKQYASDEVIEVNANTVTFTVGNTGTSPNGQVRITAIEVTYTAAAPAAAASVPTKKASQGMLLSAANVALLGIDTPMVYAEETPTATMSFETMGGEAKSQADGITFERSSANTTYYNPIRIYSGTTVTITYVENMSKIVFHCNSEKSSATVVKNSITDSNVTVTIDSEDTNMVTVEFIEPKNTLSFKCSAQYRLHSIDVYSAAKLTPEEQKAKDELDKISINTTGLTKVGDTLKLPTENTEKTVTFEWSFTDPNTQFVTLTDNVLKVAKFPDIKAVIKLTATATYTDTTGKTSTVTKSFTVTIKNPDAPVSLSIKDYATTNKWENSKQYLTVKIDDNITVTANGGGNTGKYYNSKHDWRMYSSESATMTFKATEGYIIKYVIITYNNSGKIEYNSVKYSSGDEIPASGSEFILNIVNKQIEITNIDVKYVKGTNLGTYQVEDSENPGTYKDEVVYGVLDFLGCGIRTEAPTGVRFGFALTLSTSNADTVKAVLNGMSGTFNVKVNTTDNIFNLTNVKIDGNKIIMNIVIVGELRETLCNAKIITSMHLKFGEGTTAPTLNNPGEVRVIKEVAKVAYENSELGDITTTEGKAAAKETALLYGYDPDAQAA